MKHTTLRPLCLVAALVAGAAGLRAQPTFVDLVLINPFNNTEGSFALDINDSGVLIGGDLSDRVFVWSNGAATEIVNTLGNRDVRASGLNSSGQVVGRAEQSSAPDRAYVWSSGSGMAEIPNTLSAGDAEAYGINDTGTVVGRARNVGPETNRTVAFRWTSAGGMAELVNSVFATGDSDASAINNNNQVAGVVYDQNYDATAVRWESDGSATLVSAPTDWRVSDVGAINDAGFFVGTLVDNEGSFYRAFVSDGTEVQILGTLSEDSSSYAGGLNDFGQVVGESSSGAFLFSDDQLFALNDLAAGFLVDEASVGFQSLLYAYDINNGGDIVGVGEYFDGVNFYEAGFVLTTGNTIPEPSSYAAILGGLALGVVGIRRCRRESRAVG